MITVYSKPACPYCDMAKTYLSVHEIPHSVIDISIDDDAKQFIVNQGHRTVPQIYIGQQVIEGGWSTLKTIKPEQLRDMLTQSVKSLQQGNT